MSQHRGSDMLVNRPAIGTLGLSDAPQNPTIIGDTK
jgi:hypothetical protein